MPCKQETAGKCWWESLFSQAIPSQLNTCLPHCAQCIAAEGQTHPRAASKISDTLQAQPLLAAVASMLAHFC